jgi:putative endonuclease
MAFFVYILANEPNGTLYIGMTDGLVKRVWHSRLYAAIWRKDACLVRVVRVAGVGVHARAPSQKME